jgi:hypothetical protein
MGSEKREVEVVFDLSCMCCSLYLLADCLQRLD